MQLNSDGTLYVNYLLSYARLAASEAAERLIFQDIRPRGYKTFFMLNSAELEIFSANKYENANNSWHFHIY